MWVWMLFVCREGGVYTDAHACVCGYTCISIYIYIHIYIYIYTHIYIYICIHTNTTTEAAAAEAVAAAMAAAAAKKREDELLAEIEKMRSAEALKVQQVVMCMYVHI